MADRNLDLVKVWSNDKLIKKNIDFLRTPTKEVQFPISSHLEQIIEDLIDTFKAIPCAGIAANQIQYNKMIFIGMKHDNDMDVSHDSSQNIDDVAPDPENYEIYINPQIDKQNKDSTQSGVEACLSIPGLSLVIERFDKIKVRYYNLEGRVIKKPLKGFISRLFQHELDHLNGNLMFENSISKIGVSDISKEIDLNNVNELFNYIYGK